MISQAAATVAAVAAGVAGALYLSRKALRLVRMLERLVQLAEHELSANSGSSMKDDLHAVAIATGALQRQVGQLGRRMETLEALELLGYKRPGAHKRKDRESELPSDQAGTRRGPPQH